MLQDLRFSSSALPILSQNLISDSYKFRGAFPNPFFGTFEASSQYPPSRGISHTNSSDGLLRGRISPMDNRITTPVTTNKYNKTSDEDSDTISRSCAQHPCNIPDGQHHSESQQLSTVLYSRLRSPTRHISDDPRSVERAAAHAHHPHPFAKPCFSFHDHSGDHAIDLTRWRCNTGAEVRPGLGTFGSFRGQAAEYAKEMSRNADLSELHIQQSVSYE